MSFPRLRVAFFEAACARDLEGIVAKPVDALYGANVRWVKIKNPAYTQSIERAEAFRQRRRDSGS